jgi:plastocyanin
MVDVRRTGWMGRLAVVLVAAGSVLGAAGCGDDDADEVSSGTTGSPADDDGGSGEDGGEAGTIVALDFELSSTTVAAGSEVTFRNDDSTAHTVTADDGAFDTGSVPAGETATFTAPSEPGEVAFHCEIHPSMTGTLTVGG